MPPIAFGRYQLLELIAKGGMAEVFKAKLAAAAGTEKLLCIKRILPHLSKNSDFMKLFIGEARIALPLNHGNITQVFDFGEVDGVYFLAMEYIRGQNLHSVLRSLQAQGRTLDVPATLYVAAEVCKGLHFAHTYADASGKKQVVVHRDVSPHNVLISYTGQVKLADFGIALAATKARADDGVVRGKPCYVSPEQADGENADPRSDVFSLGAVLYEMLTGVRCFEGAGDEETLARVRAGELEPPSKVKPGIDAELDAVVLKALRRDPKERYQRASDLQVALAGLLHKHAPDYTADSLAATMAELFAEEMAGEGNGARDRLLYQLAQAGVDVENRDADTGELLAMKTVALGKGKVGPVDDSAAKRRRLQWISGALAVAAAAIVVGVLQLGTSPQGPGPVDASPAAPPRSEPTEHLLPPSLIAAAQGGSAEPVAAAETPAEKTAKRAPAARRPGFLNCNSWPWSVVYINGRRLRGNTPLFRVKVAAGTHRLRFVNPELNLSREVTVSVDPEEIKTVAVSLQ